MDYLHNFGSIFLIIHISNIRHKNFSFVCLYVCLFVMLRLAPLDYETGWTGELWLILILYLIFHCINKIDIAWNPCLEPLLGGPDNNQQTSFSILQKRMTFRLSLGDVTLQDVN